jgi:tRNA A58 N-methylase Trm61
MNVGPGSRGLTLARVVMPTDRVYSYEVRPDVLNLATKNLERLGLLPFVELKERDAEEGFDQSRLPRHRSAGAGARSASKRLIKRRGTKQNG